MRTADTARAALVAPGFGPSVLGSRHVRDNARAVCDYQEGPATPARGLRARFLAALDGLQRHALPTLGDDPPVLEFEHATPAAERALRAVMALDQLPADAGYGDDERAKITEGVHAGLALLAGFDPDLVAGFHTIVGVLLCARGARPGAGGVSDCIGAIWYGPDPDWDVAHHAEYLLHEYVHQCLFLDDMVRGIFGARLDVLARADSKVISVVTRIPRDYDKAFHSAFVGQAIRELHARLGAADVAAEYAAAVTTTLAGLVARPELLTPYGRGLLAELIDRACA